MNMDPKKMAKVAAKNFGRSVHGRAWPFIASTDMIVDSVCMDQVRAAWCANAQSISPDFIMEFRKAFIEEIAAQGYTQ